MNGDKAIRNYQRRAWLLEVNDARPVAQEFVLLDICADCGAVVGYKVVHDAWHGVGDE